MLKTQVLNNKFESLRRCLVRLEAKSPTSLKELKADIDLQDVLAINLERAIQICVDIAAIIIAEEEAAAPQTMSAAFLTLQSLGYISPELAEKMQKAVGLRNTLVHEYTTIDWAIIYNVATKHLEDFRDFVRAVLAKLEKRKN